MILIASSSIDLLTRWKQGLHAISAVTEVTDLERLNACLKRYTPPLLLLDWNFPQLDDATGISSLRVVSPTTKIVVLGEPVSDDVELSLFTLGVRGYCLSDSDAATMQRLVTSILQGELWIRRALVPRLLDELTATRRNESTPVHSATRLAELTRREQQIAIMIGNGASNKQIARGLDITERTVKAHLTEIFRKLGMCDRLKLALLITTGVEIGVYSLPPDRIKARDGSLLDVRPRQTTPSAAH